MSYDQSLAHALKLKFGLGPYEPSALQLEQIKHAVTGLYANRNFVSDRDWATIVAHYCPGFGQYAYKGLDNSDLNALLVLALQSAKGR